MLAYPSEFLALATEAAERFRNSPESAAEWLEAEILKTERQDLLESCRPIILRVAMLQAIYDCRSASNKRIFSAPSPPVADVVPVGRGAAADVATDSYLNMNVCGRRLGDLLGNDLDDMAARLTAVGQGWMMRGKLLRAIRKLVPDDKRVEDCISNEKIGELDEQIKGKPKPTKANHNAGGANATHRVAAAKA